MTAGPAIEAPAAGAEVESPRNRRPLLALLAAEAISFTGNIMTAVAIPWFVLETTGSPARAGLSAFFGTLPLFLSGFFGGALVDRFGFRRMSVIADIASGINVAVIPLLYVTVGLEFWQLLACVFFGALLDPPGATARQSLIPDLASQGRVSLERANAASAAVNRASILLGPLLGGLLIASVGATTVLWIDAASFGVSAALIGLTAPGQRGRDRAAARGYWADVRDGARFLAGERIVRTLIVTFAVVNVVLNPLFAVLLPVYVREQGDGAATLGALVAALGGGMLAGTILFGWVGRRVPRRAALVTAVLAGGAPFWVLLWTDAVVVMLLTLLLTGIAFGPVSPIVATIIQEATPAELRGRVFGALGAISNGAIPLGMLATGILIDAAGLRVTLAGMGAIMLALGLAVLANPVFREIERQPAD
jgi:MFS family permease